MTLNIQLRYMIFADNADPTPYFLQTKKMRPKAHFCHDQSILPYQAF